MRKWKKVDDNDHFFITKFKFLGNKKSVTAEDRAQKALARKFYTEVREVLQGKVTPFTIRPAQVTTPTKEIAIEIAALAVKYGADFVTIKEVTLVSSYQKPEGVI
jgi:thiamine monophosphate synthase